MKKNEEKYRGIFDNMNDGVAVYKVVNDGKDFIITDFNIASEKMNKIKKENVIGKNVVDVFPGVKDFGLFKVFQRVFATGKSEHHDIAFYEDENISGWRTNFVYKLPTGEIVAIYKDETQRKIAEETLQKSEAKYRLLADNTADCVWQANMEMEFTYVNPAIFNYLGFTPEEWIGSKISEHCSREEMEKVATIASDAFVNLPDVTSTVFEISFYHKDGRKIPAEVSGKALLDDAGNFIGFQGTTRDVSERKQAEKLLQESESRQKHFSSMVRLMCDNLPDFIWAKDLENKFIFANKACCKQLLNAKDTDEPIGKTDMYFANREKESHSEIPDYHTFGEMCTNSDLTVLETKKPLRIDEFGNIKGTFLYLDVYKAPFWDESGDMIGTVGCGKDITKEKQSEKEKKKLESQLIHAQKMKALGTLAGGIAHDFNNILFPILGYSEMLLNDAPDGSSLKHGLTTILNGAERAKDLVKQILIFSRQKKQELKPLQAHLIVNEALKLIRASIPATIDIRQNISKDCGLIMADCTQIHQIVMNLTTNASHAMEENGGKLNITLKEVSLKAGDLKDASSGLYVCLMVSDTGIGMEQKTIDHIFDPYFTTKKEGKGTGLGLAVVHGIVKNHNGHINVYSEIGKGTEFHIYFPVIETQQKTSQIKAQSIEGGSERILIVDDQEIIVELQQKMLSQLGYKITTHTNSLEALETFQANPNDFDLVITDMTMPNMTGEQLAQKIMSVRADIPIIICTGFSAKMSKEKAESLGVKDFLMKPVTLNNLSSSIRKALNGK